jgi:hypothetical protein
MVRGLRVVFSLNPASRALYSYRVLEPGARGTVSAAWTAGRLRTYLVGPSGPVVYVRWDGDGLVGCVSMRDLKLEPAEHEQRR